MKHIFESLSFRLGIAVSTIGWVLINFLDYYAKFADVCFDCAQEFGKPFRIYKSGSFCCSSYFVWDGIISNIAIVIAVSVILGLIFNFTWSKVRHITLNSENDPVPNRNIHLFGILREKWNALGTSFYFGFCLSTFMWILINFADKTSQLEKVCSDCNRGYGVPFNVYEPESIIGPAHFIKEGILANMLIIVAVGLISGLVFQKFWNRHESDSKN